MPVIEITTDTSLVSNDNGLSLQLSKRSANRLEFNDKGELTLKEVKVTGYLPLNGVIGEYDVPMEQIGADSSCTRLANWNDTDGDVKETGATGVEGRDGVNLIGLFTELMTNDGYDLSVTFWPKESYAKNETYKGEWS